MSNVCQLSGKKPSVGNTRSKSQRAVKRWYKPNNQKTFVRDPVTGKKVRVKVSTRALRSLLKNPSKLGRQVSRLAK